MNTGALQFHQPLWLLLGLIPVALGLLAIFQHRWREDGYAERRLLPWAVMRMDGRWWRNSWRPALLFIAWLGFALAMAGPRVAERIWQTGEDDFTPVVVLFDVSRSMSVVESGLSRIERARVELHDLLKQASGLRLGLTVFGARAHLLTPVTHDRTVLAHYIDLLRPDMLPTAGSDITTALARAARQLDGIDGPRVILLVSDGDFGLGARADEALRKQISRYRDEGIRLFVLGVGSDQAQAIPDAEAGWLTYQGRPVTTQRNRDRLSQLAALGGGRYSDARVDNGDWELLYRDGLARLAGVDNTDHQQPVIIWEELYHWPLMLAVVLFVVAHLGGRRSGHALSILVLAFLLAGAPPTTWAAEPASWSMARAAYEEGDYVTAQRVFAALHGYRARMGEGAARYQLGQFRQASGVFIQAVLQAEGAEQRAAALFNLANCFYRLEDYVQAEALYADALRYRPGWKAAQVNRAYAREMQRRPRDDTDMAVAGRAGRGPAAARVRQGSDPGDGSLSLDDSVPPEAGLPVLPGEGNGDETRGGDRAAAVTGAVERFIDREWTYDISSTEFLPQRLEQLDTDEALVWQRLFEAEEGFHAPVAEPRSIPGVPPW